VDQQQTPQWSPPPQQPAGWGAGGMAPMSRPTFVTVAGILLIIFGVILLLAAVLAFAGGALLANAFGGVEGGGIFAGIAAFFGVIVLFWSILHFLGGIGSLQGKGWGRWIGMVVAVITVIFGVLGLLGSMGGTADGGSLIYQIIVIAIYGFIAYALITASAYFSRR
jgi:hypothetical protein